MYELHDVRYQMILRGGGDIWALHGTVMNHDRFEDGKYVAVSSPRQFDSETNTLITKSGSMYHINSWDGQGEDAIKEQILQDIANGGYEIH